MARPKKKKFFRRKKRRTRTRWTPSCFLAGFIIISLAFFATIMFLGESIIKPINTNREKEEFIIRLSDHAELIQEEHHVLPSISIAQAILESDWGTSELAVENKNLYGVKGSNPENTVVMRTKEFVDGEWIEIEAPFRKYDSWQESMDDHAALFVNGTDWNADQYADVLAAKNYKEAAQALQDNGYATDPTYVDKLIGLIEEYRLYQYDDEVK